MSLEVCYFCGTLSFCLISAGGKSDSVFGHLIREGFWN